MNDQNLSFLFPSFSQQLSCYRGSSKRVARGRLLQWPSSTMVATPCHLGVSGNGVYRKWQLKWMFMGKLIFLCMFFSPQFSKCSFPFPLASASGTLWSCEPGGADRRLWWWRLGHASMGSWWNVLAMLSFFVGSCFSVWTASKVILMWPIALIIHAQQWNLDLPWSWNQLPEAWWHWLRHSKTNMTKKLVLKLRLT